MKPNSLIRNRHFWAAIALLLVAVAIIIITYIRVYSPEIMVGPLQLYHWASVIGAGIVVVFIPLYAYVKRKYPKTRRFLFNAHMYVNLFAFLFISMHFGVIGQIKPGVDTGTGFMQFVVVVLLIFTGIIRRFQLWPGQSNIWKFLHVSLMVTFYIMLLNHIIGAVGLL